MFDGKLQPSDLSETLLTTILNDVKGATASGYGDSFYDYKTDAKSKLQLKQNLYRFSGAKTYQQLAKINFYSDTLKTFPEFKKEALKINSQYNIQYLETEWINANRAGAMAEKWQKFQSQKELYPNLQYKTVKDARVREEHAQLHDVIKPIDDVFWDTWMPQNGHRCRCYVIQTDAEPTKGTPEGNPTPGFHGNVGKTNMAFDENEHPYFIFPVKEAALIVASFSALKLTSPDYNVVHTNKKAKLEVSTWADPNDLESNLKTAYTLVDKLELSVKIRPHSDISGVKNPEYEIEGKLADRKAQSGKNVTSNLKSAKKQNCKIVVFDVQKEYPFDSKQLRNNIKGIIKQFYKKETFDTIIIVNGDVVERFEVVDWYK